MGDEPGATFSTCSGALPASGARACMLDMLWQRLDRHGWRVYLVNTGWVGGPHGGGEPDQHRLHPGHG